MAKRKGSNKNKSLTPKSLRTSPPVQRENSYRVINGLETAKALSEAPDKFKKQPKLKGARAKGIRYEKTVGRRLARRIERADSESVWSNAELIGNQWFSFFDRNGYGCCQTDYFIIFPRGFILLLECKLTQSDDAIGQMLDLYVPILKEIYDLPIVPVQVCKNMRYNPPNLLSEIEPLIEEPKHGVWTWHYLADR